MNIDMIVVLCKALLLMQPAIFSSVLLSCRVIALLFELILDWLLSPQLLRPGY